MLTSGKAVLLPPVASVTRIKGTLQVTVNVGDGEPDYVHVGIEEPDKPGSEAQRGRIFLGLAIGTIHWDGETGFTELAGFIWPHQLDELIEALTLARAKATELAILRAGK